MSKAREEDGVDLEEELDALLRRAGESGLSTLAAMIDVEEGLRQLEAETTAALSDRTVSSAS